MFPRSRSTGTFEVPYGLRTPPEVCRTYNYQLSFLVLSLKKIREEQRRPKTNQGGWLLKKHPKKQRLLFKLATNQGGWFRKLPLHFYERVYGATKPYNQPAWLVIRLRPIRVNGVRRLLTTCFEQVAAEI